MEVYLSLGSNVGDRQKAINSAIEKLQQHPTISKLRVSKMYLTAPYGLSRQRDFINCAVRLETVLTARALLPVLQEIENSLGRTREVKWGPRTIDIDILFCGSKVIQEPGIIIPHPEIHKRRFVLQPLNELCPDLVHPILKRTVRSLWEVISSD